MEEEKKVRHLAAVSCALQSYDVPLKNPEHPYSIPSAYEQDGSPKVVGGAQEVAPRRR